MHKEDKRQIFHLCFGLGFALLLHLDRIVGLVGILGVLLWGLPHYIYCKKKRIPITIEKIMNSLDRGGEKGEGAINFVIGCFFSALFFPNQYCIPAIIVLSLSDSLATIFGRRYGKNQGKSLEGSATFFLSAFLVLLIYFNAYKALATSSLLTLIEFFAKKDNLILAPSSAIISYILPI